MSKTDKKFNVETKAEWRVSKKFFSAFRNQSKFITN